MLGLVARGAGHPGKKKQKTEIQSEYYATRIMVLRNSSQPPFYMWQKIALLKLLAPTFFISINGCLNCLGPVVETFPFSEKSICGL